MTKNTLLKYRLIVDLYEKHKTPDIPLAVVWRNYVYPTYPISRQTLYNILNTPGINNKIEHLRETGQLTLTL